jgi:hypothetical protein
LASQHPYLEVEDLQIRDFQFDELNRAHLGVHGVTQDVVWDVWEGDPRVFLDLRQPTRSGSHWMIGPDVRGRYWTIVIVSVDDRLSLWRPITGWPSKAKEEQAWHDAN